MHGEIFPSHSKFNYHLYSRSSIRLLSKWGQPKWSVLPQKVSQYNHLIKIQLNATCIDKLVCVMSLTQAQPTPIKWKSRMSCISHKLNNRFSIKLAFSSLAIISLSVFGSPYLIAIFAMRLFSYNFKIAAANHIPEVFCSFLHNYETKWINWPYA